MSDILKTWFMKINWGLFIAITIPVSFGTVHLFNYAPITEGWWHVFARWITEGKVPYRDFELLVPPLYPYFIAVMQFLGLGSFFALRIFGLVLFLGIATLTFYLLIPFVEKITAGIIAAVATSYLQIGSAFIDYDYVYVAIFFVLATFVPASLFYKKVLLNIDQNPFLFIYISGASAGLALLTKQTNGLVALTFGLCTWLVLSWKTTERKSSSRCKRTSKAGGYFLLGAACPQIILVCFLTANNAMAAFISQVFSESTNVKGGLLGSLFNWLFGLLKFEFLVNSFALLVVPVVLTKAIMLSVKKANLTNEKKGGALLAPMISSCITALLGLFLWEHIVKQLSNLNFLPTILVLIFVLIQAIWSKRSPDFVPTTLAALALVWASGMSAGLAESAMFLATATSLAFFLSFIGSDQVSRLISLLVCVSLVVAFATTKQIKPFTWWGLSTPTAADANERIDFGLQAGLMTNWTTKEMLVKTRAALSKAKTCPGESLAYPHVPLFLLDVGELPNGRLATYWYDFASQRSIHEEIRRLENTNLRALVFVTVPETVLAGHERLFSQGRPYAQRELSQLLLSKVKKDELDGIWDLGGGYVLSVYTRKCISR